MKTEDIKKMALALESVKGKKLDPVGKHDKDIDNDGDHDKTDKYLINRRKKISSSISKDKANTEVQVQESEELDELSQDTLSSYHAKAGADRQKLKAKVQAGWKKKKPSAASIKATGDAYAKFAKRGRGMTMAANKMKEDVEEIEELSKKTLGSYIKKAGGTSLNSTGAHMADYGASGNPKAFKKGINRAKGVMRAADRLTKEDLDEAVNASEYSTHGVKSQFGGYRAEIKHKTKGHTMYSGAHTYKSAEHAKGEADAYLKGYSSTGETAANAHARRHAETHAIKGPSAKKAVKENTQIDELTGKGKINQIHNKIRSATTPTNNAHAAIGKEKGWDSPEARSAKKKIDRLSAKHAQVTHLKKSLHARIDGDDAAVKKNLDNAKHNSATARKYAKEEVEGLEELSRTTVRNYIRKARADNAERKDKVMAPFKMKDMDKNVAMYAKMKKRDASINTAGEKAYPGITGPSGKRAKVHATEEVENIEELSKDTLRSYMNKAVPDVNKTRKTAMKLKDPKKITKAAVHIRNRTQGVMTASKKMKEDLDEGYKENEQRWMDQLTAVTSEIADMAEKLYADHYAACEASKRISAAYAAGKTPSDADREMANKKVYDIKYLIRQLEDVRDSLEMKSPSEPEEKVASVSTGRYYESVNPTKESPISIRQALAMMEDRALQTAGATEPEAIDDKLSGKEKGWINVHAMEIPDETNIDAATDKNKTEVEASLQRAVNYRHNDQKIGDK